MAPVLEIVESPCLESGVGGRFAEHMMDDWEDLYRRAFPSATTVPDFHFDSLQALVMERCTDGEDNDNDGFADCDDWDCNWNPIIRGLCEADDGSLVCG